MKVGYKEYLFEHGIFVHEGLKDNTAFELNYLLGQAYGIRIVSGAHLAQKDMLILAALMLGRSVPEPFYRGFPDSVRKLCPDELEFDQLYHYFLTYGVGDFSAAGHSVFEEYIGRTALKEQGEIKDFVVLIEEDAIHKLEQYAEELLAGTRPVNESQYVFLVEFIKDYQYEVKACASKNLAARLLADSRDLKYAKFLELSDVIKLVDEINYQSYQNMHVNHLHFNNQDRKFVTQVIDYMCENGKCDLRNCYEKKDAWCGLLHHIHYRAKCEVAEKFVTCMRGKENHSVYSEFEKAMGDCDIEEAIRVLLEGKGSGALLRNLTYILSRCKNDEDVCKVMENVKSSNPIILMQLLLNYSNARKENEGRTFKFVRHDMMLTHTELPEEMARRKSYLSREVASKICDLLWENLGAFYKNKLGKVYVDPAMQRVALPLQEGTSAGGYGVLSKGTRIPITLDKKIRAFTYWEKVDDIDLSVMGITDDGQQCEFSWRTMADKQSPAITFSGDETAGYDGGSEYFDIDVELIRKEYPTLRYLVFCDNVYSMLPFGKCVCRAGYMLRDTEDSGEVFEPKTVKSSFVVNCDSTFAYLFALDLKEAEFIWLNVARNGNTAVAGDTSFGFLLEYFDVTKVLNVQKFFGMLASKIVDSPDLADVVVTDRTVETNPGVEVIRSYDFERLISLMNGAK